MRTFDKDVFIKKSPIKPPFPFTVKKKDSFLKKREAALKKNLKKRKKNKLLIKKGKDACPIR